MGEKISQNPEEKYELTELASEILFKAGNLNIYQETIEDATIAYKCNRLKWRPIRECQLPEKKFA